MKCTNCGCELNEGMTFCTNCGAKIEDTYVNSSDESESTEPAEDTTSEKKVVLHKKSIKLSSKQKKIFLSAIIIVLVLALTGTGTFVLIERNNFSSCFETVKTELGTETINSIVYKFKVKNNVLRKNVVFGVKSEDKDFTCSPDIWKSSDGSIEVVVQPPEDGKSYADSFEVECYAMSGDNTLWSEKKTIPFNTKDVFVHKGKLTYNGITKEIEVTDHQNTVINLTELFNNFDTKKHHSLDINNVSGKDGIDIELRTDPSVPLGDTSRRIHPGGYLVVEGHEHNIVSGFECVLSDKTAASEVNWDKYIDAYNWIADSTPYIRSPYAVSKLYISALNMSDESINVSLEGFYINNNNIKNMNYFDAEEVTTSSKTYLSEGESTADGIYVFFLLPKEYASYHSDIRYVGAEVVIRDADGNEVYRKVRNYDTQ